MVNRRKALSRLGRGAAVLGLAIAAIGFMGAPAQLATAQTAAPPPGPLAQPSTDPRDFTGVWMQRGYSIRYPLVGGGSPPYLEWAAAEARLRAEAQRIGRPIGDSTAACLPSGVPRVMGAPYPIQILQTPKQVVILHEVQHLFQFVFMNEEHPAELDPTYMGHSVGRWDGDTLVIDTVALVKDTLINEAGDPHSEKLHVIQRWTKSADGRQIENLITVDDPGAYSKPWTYRLVYHWRPEVRFIEYICEENNRDAPSKDGAIQKGPGG